ncbi:MULTISPECIES: 3-hydroxybutyrate dehydrogenase [Actinopolyspora]|uniref:3-hydroxybutyrate dehydrogenase n=1 Tax=Actinopolyspora saharensis TaxID=995062 RepID=A0A1H0ZWM9_9ACTN|nr:MULTISPECIES: 3-hydroxybutyrate dehydrogenase [Actinopolyspora]NHD15540.1 SDR family oxidoreductase [Actinopolyspora sp. BKK2]NHE75246.1 SDR family oxidoreductase [Actinopolyspora sp. BKK1]SDQ31793.1 3-hydroxybutyrate dehydrogenase [Actinopolyspora saharensis]
MTTDSGAEPARTAELSGTTALVTGAASGIGYACAARLAAAGCSVHLADLDRPAVLRAASELDGHPHAVDLTEETALGQLPAEVDILVNNAGIQHVAPIHEFPTEVFTRIQHLMVTVPFLLIRHCLPHMYARGWGRVLNISSVHGLRASPNKSAYVAAKHALEGLSKVTALEGARYGVTSNCVDPGYVRTPLLEGQLAAQAETNGITEDEVADRVFLQHSAIKRLIEPEEVAAVVGWLCGPGSDHLTGTSVPIDGAWTAH